MTNIASRYIDPLTDYGFKHIFGNEPDKDIMIDFLNALFEGEKIIVISPTALLNMQVKMRKKKKCSLI